jgi:pimeloyl-ACP methyl ester carboxylesterase
MTSERDDFGARRFQFRDGASISLQPGHSSQPIVLYYGRDNRAAGDPLSRALLQALSDRGWRVAELDAVEHAMNRALDWDQRLGRLPRWQAWAVKIVRLILRPKLWPYYIHRLRLGRAACIRKSALGCIRASAMMPDIILGYSAGARFGSAIVDELAVKAVVCFGYPFRHPEHGDEPERYTHLATIETPCLIVQGRNDSYGGSKDLAGYPLSQAVQVRFVDADHNLNLDAPHQQEVVDMVLDFLNALGLLHSVMARSNDGTTQMASGRASQ